MSLSLRGQEGNLTTTASISLRILARKSMSVDILRLVSSEFCIRHRRLLTLELISSAMNSNSSSLVGPNNERLSRLKVDIFFNV